MVECAGLSIAGTKLLPNTAVLLIDTISQTKTKCSLTRMAFQTTNLLITDFRALGWVPSQDKVLQKHKRANTGYY